MSRKGFALVFFVSLFWQGLSLEFAARQNSDLVELSGLTTNCFERSKLQICRDALALAEFLQLYAGSKKKFACQTRLLGLGSELIMRTQNSFQNGAKLTMLDEVKEFCKDL